MTDDEIAMTDDLSAAAVGARLKAVRGALGVTQAGLAATWGVDESAVRHAERGRNYPPAHKLVELLRPNGITLDFVFGGDWRSLPAGKWAEIRAQISSGR